MSEIEPSLEKFSVLYTPSSEPLLHKCDLPHISFPRNTLIRCDDCGRVYRLSHGDYSFYWQRLYWFLPQRWYLQYKARNS